MDVVAIPIVAVANNERYAEFITTGIVIGAFVLTGTLSVLFLLDILAIGTTILHKPLYKRRGWL